MIRFAVFDWNGTLFADTQAVVDAGNHVIQRYGGTPLSRARYTAEFDFPVRAFLERQGCALRDGYENVFHEFYEQRARQCRTRKGARQVLSFLQDRSIDSVILSNHIAGAIHDQLLRLDLVQYIATVLGNETREATGTGYNKIERLREYLDRTGFDPAQGMVVGDAPEDIGIGKQFGMTTVGMHDGYYGDRRVLACKPDYMIESLPKLIDIVKEKSR